MKVKVWNDGPIDHVEEYQDETIKIPRGEYIEMPRSKAIHFLSQLIPFHRDGDPKARGIKALRMEEPAEEKAAMMDQPLRFTASDGTKFRTQIGLDDYEASLTVGKPNGRRKTS